MSATDPFDGASPGLAGVFIGGAAVTPSDSTDLAFVARGLHIGVAGDVKIKAVDNSDLTFTCVAGQVLPWGVRRVYSTGTTATSIVAGK